MAKAAAVPALVSVSGSHGISVGTGHCLDAGTQGYTGLAAAAVRSLATLHHARTMAQSMQPTALACMRTIAQFQHAVQSTTHTAVRASMHLDCKQKGRCHGHIGRKLPCSEVGFM